MVSQRRLTRPGVFASATLVCGITGAGVEGTMVLTAGSGNALAPSLASVTTSTSGLLRSWANL